MYQTLEELQDNEEICNYCELDPNTNYSSPGNGYFGCEGAYCDRAYESYLEEMEISETVIKIKTRTIVKIERG